MKLSEFIKTAISEIGTGVTSAHPHYCVVAPMIIRQEIDGEAILGGSEENTIQYIEFDIAITVAEISTRTKSSGIAGGVKSGSVIEVLGIKAGVDAKLEEDKKLETQNSNVSRIKFSVPILFRGDQIFLKTQSNKKTVPKND
jgi:hypothetical protein